MHHPCTGQIAVKVQQPGSVRHAVWHTMRESMYTTLCTATGKPHAALQPGASNFKDVCITKQSAHVGFVKNTHLSIRATVALIVHAKVASHGRRTRADIGHRVVQPLREARHQTQVLRCDRHLQCKQWHQAQHAVVQSLQRLLPGRGAVARPNRMSFPSQSNPKCSVIQNVYE